MNLKHAIQIVTQDTRESNPEQSWTPKTAVPFIRAEMTEEDVRGGVDDPKVKDADYTVLNASDAQIRKALG